MKYADKYHTQCSCMFVENKGSQPERRKIVPHVDFQNRLKNLKWNNVQASERLGVSERTIYNYVKGKRSIPTTVWKLLYLYSNIEKAKDLLG